MWRRRAAASHWPPRLRVLVTAGAAATTRSILPGSTALQEGCPPAEPTMPSVPSSLAAGLRSQRPLKFTIRISRNSTVNNDNHGWCGGRCMARGGPCPPQLPGHPSPGNLTVGVGREQPPTPFSLSAPVLSTPGAHRLSPDSSPCLAGILKEGPLERRVPVPDGCLSWGGGRGGKWVGNNRAKGRSKPRCSPVWGSTRGRRPLSNSNLPLLLPRRFFPSSRPSERGWAGEASLGGPANDGARQAAEEAAR